MYIAADKTTNFYKVDENTYNELLEKHIHKDYKKTTTEAVKEVSKVDKEIVTKLEIADRVYSTTGKQAFVTLKDHKPSFNNNPTCRLLNPTKPEIGKISQKILAKINATVRDKTKLNQWQNTQSVVDWFSSLENKERLSFIQYDVDNFYVSISEELINKSLDFASNYVTISLEDRKIILQSKPRPASRNMPRCLAV